FGDRIERLIKKLSKFHQRNPLLPGMAKQDLRNQELPDGPAFLMDALLGAAKDIVVEGETVRLSTHRVILKQDEQQARQAIVRAFEQAGLAVPAVAEVLAKSGVELSRARSLLQILIRERELIRVSEDLVFHHAAIAKLRALLASHRATRFNVATFKDWTGV